HILREQAPSFLAASCFDGIEGRHKSEKGTRIMKPLLVISFIVGLFGIPLQALAQAPADAPLQFNGLYFDPPVQEHWAPDVGGTPSARYRQPRRAAPSHGPGIDTFDANAA